MFLIGPIDFDNNVYITSTVLCSNKTFNNFVPKTLEILKRMADVCIPQFSTKFPNTEPLDTCYNSVVPTSTAKYEGIQHLKSVLTEKKQSSLG